MSKVDDIAQTGAAEFPADSVVEKPKDVPPEATQVAEANIVEDRTEEHEEKNERKERQSRTANQKEAGEPVFSAIAAKLFVDLVQDVTTSNHGMTWNTEIVDGWESTGVYSPVGWAEAQTLVGWGGDAADETLTEVMATTVQVSSGRRAGYGLPKLTPKGEELMALTERSIAESSAIRSLIPVTGMVDQYALCALLSIRDTQGVNAWYDEAPLLRLWLLHFTMTPNTIFRNNSRLALDVVMNMNLNKSKGSPVSNGATTWAKCRSDTLHHQIGSAKGTSTIWVRTAQDYFNILTGNGSANNARLRTTTEVVDPSEVVWIPVKMAWNGDTSLMPYILAHTTTNWWNGARYYNAVYDIVDPISAGKKFEAVHVPRSCLPIIRGMFKYICLVIVDAANGTAARKDWSIGTKLNIPATDGFDDFSAAAYEWMGRKSTTTYMDKGNYRDTWVATHRLCSSVGFGEISTRMKLLAMEMSFSFHNGWSVRTGEQKATKAETAPRPSTLAGDLDMNDPDNAELIANATASVNEVAQDAMEVLTGEMAAMTRMLEIARRALTSTTSLMHVATDAYQRILDSSASYMEIVEDGKATEAALGEAKILRADMAATAPKKDQDPTVMFAGSEMNAAELDEHIAMLEARHAKLNDDLICTHNPSEVELDAYNRECVKAREANREALQYVESLEVRMEELARNGEDLKKLADEEGESGPYTYGPKADTHMQILKKLPDLEAMTAVKRANIMEGLDKWRVTPLHKFFGTRVKMYKKTDEWWPAFDETTSDQYQYLVFEASPIYRILFASSVFVGNAACLRVQGSEHDAWFCMKATAVLAAATTELSLIQLGLSHLDLSRITRHWKALSAETFDYWARLTDGTSMSLGPSASAYVGSDDWKKNILVSIGLTKEEMETWSCGVLPWWFLNSVYQKWAGKSFISRKQIQVNSVAGAGAELYGVYAEQGYYLTVADSQFDLPYLSASRGYEKPARGSVTPFFKILTTNRDFQGMGVHKQGWMPWRYLDYQAARVAQKQTPSHMKAIEGEDGYVELAAIWSLTSRLQRVHFYPQNFVSKDNRNVTIEGKTQQIILGGMKYPDPILDWLKKGLLTIAPDLLMGNVPGAIKSGVGYVSDTVIDWLNKKWNSLDPGGGTDSFRD